MLLMIKDEEDKTNTVSILQGQTNPFIRALPLGLSTPAKVSLCHRSCVDLSKISCDDGQLNVSESIFSGFS